MIQVCGERVLSGKWDEKKATERPKKTRSKRRKASREKPVTKLERKPK